MSFVKLFIFLLTISIWQQLGICADLPLHAFDYQENFEGKDPFQFWTSNGTYTINNKGLSNSRASSGSSSFKLDITLGTSTYVYWMIPVKVPNYGTLRFSADIYLESAQGTKIALGTNVSLSPAPLSGINTLEPISNPTGKWVTQSSDLVAPNIFKVLTFVDTYFGGASGADVGNWTDRVGLFIYGQSGGRVVVYIDNIRIQGSVPETQLYQSETTSAWNAYLSRIHNEVTSYANYILGYSGALASNDASILQDAKAKATIIKSAVDQRGYPTPAEYAQITYLNRAANSLTNYNVYTTTHPSQSVVLFPIQTVRKPGLKVTPFTWPLDVSPGNSLEIKACTGEYEPASFIIRARQLVSNIRITSTDLVSANQSRISAGELDIRLVKCWYQAGEGKITYTNQKTLVPELLLKDDKLVKVDYAQNKNYLRATTGTIEQYIDISSTGQTFPINAVVQDAEVLQPFDVEFETNKQIWITVHIPENTPPGDYTCTITLQTDQNGLAQMNLTVKVLPFQLKPAMIEYGLFYRGMLTDIYQTSIGKDWKSANQYLTELLDMKNHGVLYPTLYQPMDSKLAFALELRGQAGLPKNKLYILGADTGNAADSAGLADLGNEVTSWVTFTSGYNYSSLYFYGKDEATEAALASQRPAWQTVREKGGRVFATCYQGAVDIVGDIMDTAVLSGTLNVTEAAKWHNEGKQVVSYGNPQVGVEDADIYRRNYGIGLVCSGYDGALDYAYQHAFGAIWNDFDDPQYRDHVFAYPTSNGVIDTVQWEGFREGVDDVKYLSTLISIRGSERESLIRNICRMLTNQSDLSYIRDVIISKILESTSTATPVPSNFRIAQ